LIYEPVVDPDASIHAAGHLHDPYDTIDLAREMGDVLEQMARVALTAVLDTAQEDIPLRVTPRPDRRALFVGSHTEAEHMTPAGFVDLGPTLAMEGLDVDLIPYGQAVTPADLEKADLVVILPVLDYPTAEGDPDLYDEAWTEAEIDALESYVAGGGLLVLTNSLHRLKYGNAGLDANEDWSDANALASRFGVTYQEGALPGSLAQVVGDHPLMEGMDLLEFGDGNGVPFDLEEGVEGQVLAQDGSYPAAVVVDHGDARGQVLVLADVGMLTAGWSTPRNLPFWRNLAGYTRSR